MDLQVTLQKVYPLSLGKESLVDMDLNARVLIVSLDMEDNLWSIAKALQENLQIIGSRLISTVKFSQKEGLCVRNLMKIEKSFYRSVTISVEWNYYSYWSLK